LQRNAHGKVRVTLLIDETGSVNEVSMVEAEPAGYFEHAVRKAA
jgi:TonB family protein